MNKNKKLLLTIFIAAGFSNNAFSDPRKDYEKANMQLDQALERLKQTSIEEQLRKIADNQVGGLQDQMGAFVRNDALNNMLDDRLMPYQKRDDAVNAVQEIRNQVGGLQDQMGAFVRNDALNNMFDDRLMPYQKRDDAVNAVQEIRNQLQNQLQEIARNAAFERIAELRKQISDSIQKGEFDQALAQKFAKIEDLLKTVRQVDYLATWLGQGVQDNMVNANLDRPDGPGGPGRNNGDGDPRGRRPNDRSGDRFQNQSNRYNQLQEFEQNQFQNDKNNQLQDDGNSFEMFNSGINKMPRGFLRNSGYSNKYANPVSPSDKNRDLLGPSNQRLPLQRRGSDLSEKSSSSKKSNSVRKALRFDGDVLLQPQGVQNQEQNLPEQKNSQPQEVQNLDQNNSQPQEVQILDQNNSQPQEVQNLEGKIQNEQQNQIGAPRKSERNKAKDINYKNFGNYGPGEEKVIGVQPAKKPLKDKNAVKENDKNDVKEKDNKIETRNKGKNQKGKYLNMVNPQNEESQSISASQETPDKTQQRSGRVVNKVDYQQLSNKGKK